MATYLDYDGFTKRTTLPPSFVCDVEDRDNGWIATQLETWARWIDSRLRKRYETPFAAFDATPPTPPTIQLWLTRIVTWRVMLRRGVDPNDLQADTIKADHDLALEELLEAANSENGWFDLPVRTDANGTAISQGSPLFYSEQSPYVHMDVQECIGRSEDESGTGSGG